MDLQTTRNIEQFIRLLGLRNVQVAPRIELAEGPFSMFIDAAEGLPQLSAGMTLPSEHTGRALNTLLARCDPRNTFGLPMRVYVLDEQIVLSCTLPQATPAGLWLRVHRLQRLWLEGCLNAY
jgi:type III secretion system chaperone SycN